jgi:hypothetical protein
MLMSELIASLQEYIRCVGDRQVCVEEGDVVEHGDCLVPSPYGIILVSRQRYLDAYEGEDDDYASSGDSILWNRYDPEVEGLGEDDDEDE